MCAPVFGKESLRLLRRHLPLGKGGFPYGKLGYPSFVKTFSFATFPSGKAALRESLFYVGAHLYVRPVFTGQGLSLIRHLR